MKIQPWQNPLTALWLYRAQGPSFWASILPRRRRWSFLITQAAPFVPLRRVELPTPKATVARESMSFAALLIFSVGYFVWRACFV